MPVLMPHQHIGAAFLAAHRFALLADEPGAGKTAQVVVGAWKEDVKNVLVLCPASLRTHWAREFSIWGDRHDAQVRPGRITEVLPGLTIAGHSAMSHEPSFEQLVSHHWDLVIVDESHEFRSITARRTRNLFGSADRSLCRATKRLWLLTGSPIVNSAADLYPMLSSVFSGDCNIPYDEFIHRYTDVVVNDFGEAVCKGIKLEHELSAWLAPHMLRRADFMDLPQRTTAKLQVNISDQELAEATQHLAGLSPAQIAARMDWGYEPDEGSSLSVVRRVLGIAKVPAAAQRIRWIMEQGGCGPVVVFFHHRDVRAGLHRLLQETRFNVDWIDGQTSPSRRVESVDAFQAGKTDILLVQIQAGGTGLTLTRACYCMVVELPWTSVALEQAIARVHRLTQTRPVYADIVASQCWLDQVMAETLITKATAAKRLLTPLLTVH